MSANGYRVQCSVCGRSQMSGHSPLQRGWPRCCGYTMTLTDTKRFISDVDREVGKSFGKGGGVTAAGDPRKLADTDRVAVRNEDASDD